MENFRKMGRPVMIVMAVMMATPMLIAGVKSLISMIQSLS